MDNIHLCVVCVVCGVFMCEVCVCMCDVWVCMCVCGMCVCSASYRDSLVSLFIFLSVFNSNVFDLHSQSHITNEVKRLK